MPIYTFPIFNVERAWAFPAIRSKEQIIEIWIRSALKILSNIQSDGYGVAGRLHLIRESSSRLIFDSQDSRYSIGFPFTVKQISINEYHVSFLSYQLEHETLQDLLSIVTNRDLMSSPNHYDFFGAIEEIQDTSISNWEILREMFCYEDAYFRQDEDPGSSDPVKHPLHHFDIGYSNRSTYKIGLRSKYQLERVIDIIRDDKPTAYLEDIAR